MKKSAKKEKELKVEIKEVKEEVKVEAVEEVAAEVKEEVKVEKKAKKEKKEKVKKEKINLPNLLTVVRICLVPVFVLLLVLEDLWVGLRYIALGIFIIGSGRRTPRLRDHQRESAPAGRKGRRDARPARGELQGISDRPQRRAEGRSCGPLGSGSRQQYGTDRSDHCRSARRLLGSGALRRSPRVY